MHRDDHAADPGPDDFRDTRRRALLQVATRLKGDIERRPSGTMPCLPQCEDFCVGSSRPEMKTLSDDATLTNHQGPNHRIWACRSPALRGQAKGQGHIAKVVDLFGHRLFRATRDRRRLGRTFVDLTRDDVAG